MKALLFVGIGLVVLWLVLTLARVAIGALLWVILIAGLIALAIYAVQAFRARSSTPA